MWKLTKKKPVDPLAARMDALENVVQIALLEHGLRIDALLDYAARKVEDRHALEFATVPAVPERVEVRRKA